MRDTGGFKFFRATGPGPIAVLSQATSLGASLGATVTGAVTSQRNGLARPGPPADPPQARFAAVTMAASLSFCGPGARARAFPFPTLGRPGVPVGLGRRSRPGVRASGSESGGHLAWALGTGWTAAAARAPSDSETLTRKTSWRSPTRGRDESAGGVCHRAA